MDLGHPWPRLLLRKSAHRASKSAILPICEPAPPLGTDRAPKILGPHKGAQYVGGGGRYRTGVRKSSATRSTCLFRL